MRPSFLNSERVGLVVECACDQHVEADVCRLPGGRDQIWTRHGAELGSDEDRRAFLGSGVLTTLDVASFRADELARPGGDGGERDPVLLVRLLDAGGPEVLQNDVREVLRFPVAEPRLRHVVDELVVLVDAEDAVRRNALHREGTGDADLPPVLVGLVVQVLEVGLCGDGGVNLPLAGDAGLPPSGVQVGRGRLPRVAGAVGNIVQCVAATQRRVQRAERCVPGLDGLRGVELLPGRDGRIRPWVSGLSWNLPLLPRAPERVIQL